MFKIIVAGIGTDVGKTVVSAILATLLEGDYWKPIQSGASEDSDSIKMQAFIEPHRIHPPAYTLQAPLSPHHAARLENILICPRSIVPPLTTRPLIIEGAGGIFVPLTTNILTCDVLQTWECRWVVVSRHYLGSINHTLLTLEALKQRKIPIAGLVFNGDPNLDSEEAILAVSQAPLLGRIVPEPHLTPQTIQRYATQWKQNLNLLVP